MAEHGLFGLTEHIHLCQDRTWSISLTGLLGLYISARFEHDQYLCQDYMIYISARFEHGQYLCQDYMIYISARIERGQYL